MDHKYIAMIFMIKSISLLVVVSFHEKKTLLMILDQN